MCFVCGHVNIENSYTILFKFAVIQIFLVSQILLQFTKLVVPVGFFSIHYQRYTA